MPAIKQKLAMSPSLELVDDAFERRSSHVVAFIAFFFFFELCLKSCLIESPFSDFFLRNALENFLSRLRNLPNLLVMMAMSSSSISSFSSLWLSFDALNAVDFLALFCSVTLSLIFISYDMRDPISSSTVITLRFFASEIAVAFASQTGGKAFKIFLKSS
ncbi:hypothetical protein U1Q18_052386 [Sarracenia purpurea var. burkii]